VTDHAHERDEQERFRAFIRTADEPDKSGPPDHAPKLRNSLSYLPASLWFGMTRRMRPVLQAGLYHSLRRRGKAEAITAKKDVARADVHRFSRNPEPPSLYLLNHSRKREKVLM